MRNWFLGGENWKVDPKPQLWGSNVKKFDDLHDLVALRVPADQDRLSDFILNHFGRFFKVHGNLIYSLKRLRRSDANLLFETG